MEYSTNERAASVMGSRRTDVIAIDEPCELGYWCPVCRILPLKADGNYDERLTWSEYNGFLWCSVCNFDYPSALCVRLSGKPQTKNAWEKHGREAAVEVFLSTIESARESVESGGE